MYVILNICTVTVTVFIFRVYSTKLSYASSNHLYFNFLDEKEIVIKSNLLSYIFNG